MFFEDHLLENSDTEDPLSPITDYPDDTGASTQVAGISSQQLLLPRLGGGGSASSLIPLLIEATENERHAPDLLPYPGAVIDGVVRQVALRRSQVSALSEQEKAAAAAAPSATSLLPFRPSDIMGLELQRVQFFLCELLRCRLRKIEALCTSIYYEGCQEDGSSNTPTLSASLLQRGHLSPNERVVADRLATSKQKAVLQVGLQASPEPLQHLTPNPPMAEGLEILPTPNLNTYVFGVALEDLGVVQVAEYAEQTIEAGDIFLIPYRTFRPYVMAGQVRLV